MEFVDKIIELAGESTVADKEPISWSEVERSLGLVLPEEYKVLVSKYFTVNLGPFSLITPRAGTPGESDLLVATTECKEIFTDLYADDPDEIAEPHRQDGSPLGDHTEVFDFYPTVPGLLLWGVDYMGGDYYWYVDGPPEEWTVVAHARDGWWDEHKMPMSAYLHGVVTRTLECDVAPQLFKDDKLFKEWPWPED